MSKPAPDRPEVTQPNHSDPDLDHEELIAAVAQAFCDGFPPATIPRWIMKQHGIEITREAPYKLLKQAAARGWLKYRPPNDTQLTLQMEAKYPWLKDAVTVRHSRSIEQIADATAGELIKLALQLHKTQPEVHIGMSGGNTMRLVALHLAEQLGELGEELPRIVLHALVAGFDVHRPYTDPNAFFTYFEEPQLEGRIGYVGLHAPALVEPARMQTMFNWPGIQEAKKAVDDIDIIVTSGGVSSDDHAMFNTLLKGDDSPDRGGRDKESQKKIVATIEALQADGWVGDVLWLPLSASGPISCENHPFRTMSVIELDELATTFVSQGKHVVLALGPCSMCGRSKTPILDVVLRLPEDQRLISRLVVDSLSVRSLVEESARNQ